MHKVVTDNGTYEYNSASVATFAGETEDFDRLPMLPCGQCEVAFYVRIMVPDHGGQRIQLLWGLRDADGRFPIQQPITRYLCHEEHAARSDARNLARQFGVSAYASMMDDGWAFLHETPIPDDDIESNIRKGRM